MSSLLQQTTFPENKEIFLEASTPEDEAKNPDLAMNKVVVIIAKQIRDVVVKAKRKYLVVKAEDEENLELKMVKHTDSEDKVKIQLRSGTRIVGQIYQQGGKKKFTARVDLMSSFFKVRPTLLRTVTPHILKAVHKLLGTHVEITHAKLDQDSYNYNFEFKEPSKEGEFLGEIVHDVQSTAKKMKMSHKELMDAVAAHIKNPPKFKRKAKKKAEPRTRGVRRRGY